MNRNRLIVGCIVIAALPWPLRSASARYVVNTGQVAAALGNLGVKIDPSQVTLLADAVAASPSSALQVRSVERLALDRFVTRLECGSREECLPFMASVRLNRDEASQLAAASSKLSILKDSSPESSAQSRTKTVLVRGGSRAVLQLDGGHVHIRIPVTCLQSGTEGQTVRATGPNRRQIYAAKVVGDGLLQGRL